MIATPNPPGKDALTAAAEVVKYLTALGTGAIVFSAGLLNEKIFLPTSAKWFIFGSWCLLAISVLGGLLAGMRIPVLLSEEKYDLEDEYLKYPGLVQQVTFFFGVVLLGVALTVLLATSGKQQPSEHVPVTQPSPHSSATPGVQQGRNPNQFPRKASLSCQSLV